MLLGAVRDEWFIIPVQMEVKEYLTADNGLYLTVALIKINESEVGNTPTPGEATATTYLFPDSRISIRKVFKKVKVEDQLFLKYVPEKLRNRYKRYLEGN